MSEPTLDSTEGLVDWFRRGGVTGPLRHCTGPLPLSRASIVRWSSDRPDTTIQTIGAHANNYRIAVLLEPLESQIWNGESPVCGGMIGANRFRICPPGSQGRWRRMSSCDIVNIFIPTATINTLGRLRDAETPSLLADTSYTPDRVVLDLVGKLLNAQLLAGSLAQHFCDSMITALASYLLENYKQPLRYTPAKSACPYFRMCGRRRIDCRPGRLLRNERITFLPRVPQSGRLAASSVCDEVAPGTLQPGLAGRRCPHH